MDASKPGIHAFFHVDVVRSLMRVAPCARPHLSFLLFGTQAARMAEAEESSWRLYAGQNLGRRQTNKGLPNSWREEHCMCMYV
jgi:hypothetical protein